MKLLKLIKMNETINMNEIRNSIKRNLNKETKLPIKKGSKEKVRTRSIRGVRYSRYRRRIGPQVGYKGANLH